MRGTSINETLIVALAVVVLSSVPGAQASHRVLRFALSGRTERGGAPGQDRCSCAASGTGRVRAVAVVARRSRLAGRRGLCCRWSRGVLMAVAIVTSTIGLAALQDAWAFSQEVLAKGRSVATSAGAIFENLALRIPINIELYISGGTFVFASQFCSRFELSSTLNSSRFCLFFLVIAYLTSSIVPLVYWKKTAIFVVPLLFLSVDVVRCWLEC